MKQSKWDALLSRNNYLSTSLSIWHMYILIHCVDLNSTIVPDALLCVHSLVIANTCPLFSYSLSYCLPISLFYSLSLCLFILRSLLLGLCLPISLPLSLSFSVSHLHSSCVSQFLFLSFVPTLIIYPLFQSLPLSFSPSLLSFSLSLFLSLSL